MGCYVNPYGAEKEMWLIQNGGEPTEQPQPISETHLPVCLVDNGHFTAAAVGYKQAEVDAFNDPEDYRPKMWFLVSRETLRTVSDLASWEK